MAGAGHCGVGVPVISSRWHMTTTEKFTRFSRIVKSTMPGGADHLIMGGIPIYYLFYLEFENLTYLTNGYWQIAKI